jgi:predicted GIY-YIG superfamily endonuclease
MQPKLEMNFVYILQSISEQDRFYTGLCADVNARLRAHNAGKSAHTAKYKPWKLISFHYFERPETAVAFERYLKSGSGRAFALRHLR